MYKFIVELLDTFRMKQTQMYVCTLEVKVIALENTLVYIHMQQWKRNVRIALG